MRYWKRVNPDGTTRTVESYSHDLDVEGAVEISQVEFDGYIASLPLPDPTIEIKRREAHARAVQAIKDNAGASPWGKILNDVAIAQGWIEPV